MKIKDLFENSYHDPGIRKHLESLGYKFLGAGIDQAAYLDPKGKVLKIFGATSANENRFSAAHLMFKTWVTFCEENESDEFLPKFYGWESFEYKNRKYLQIKMERLTKLPQLLGELLENISDDAQRTADSSSKNEEMKQRWLDKVGEYDDGYKYDYGNDLAELILLIGKDGFDKLWNTFVKIRKVGISKGYRNDLHPGNFMHRNDGIPVIVDPWVIDAYDFF